MLGLYKEVIFVQGMLDNGVESMGAMSRTYDKYGKRLHTCTPTMDNSNKHSVESTPSKGKTTPMGYDSNSKRSGSF